MTREKLLNIVTIALQDCRTAKNDSLQNYFTSDEIADFANTVVAYLPPTVDVTVGNMVMDVMDMLAVKKTFVHSVFLKYVKQVYAKLLKEDETVEVDLYHLIILALITLREQYDKNLDEVLNDAVGYYNSLLIDSNDLAKNVHEIPSYGAVAEFDNKGNYMRVNYETIEFVPTLTTKQNFNYLIPETWKT